jgi:Tol biopolymer transport system component
MRIITDTPGINTIGYPTCRTWSRDGRSLFVESGRLCPDGASHPGERQLLNIDVADGKVTHLATLEAEDTAKYGQAHLSASSHYHADYAPIRSGNVLVYFDMTGHNMYLLDPETGRSMRILHEPEGTIADPPSISTDGTRVVYYAFYPGIENRMFTGRVSVIFALDVDPVKLEAVGEPRVVVAFPARKGPTYAENPRDKVHVNHCQINPANKDHIAYAHEFHNIGVDGSLLKTRLWQVMADGSDNRPLVRQTPGEAHTHEVFGPRGECLYFVDYLRQSVCAVELATGETRLIFEAPGHYPNHITVSPDERWIAADTWADEGTDSHGNPMSGILLVDTQTGRQEVICRFPRGQKHPAHPHPSFNPDGSKIAFTLADGPHSQVAFVDAPGVGC